MKTRRKGSWLLQLLRGYKIFNRFTLILLTVTLIFLIYHFCYSISVISNLVFPAKSDVLTLDEEEAIIIEGGLLNEQYVYVLGAGDYVEVLHNKKGHFYLAPPKSFYKTARPRNGLAVGGIYVPSEESQFFYIWELPLKNEERSYDSPSPSRMLSTEFDQPERDLLLKPDWYSSKEFGIFESVLINTDFKISSDKFRSLDDIRQTSRTSRSTRRAVAAQPDFSGGFNH